MIDCILILIIIIILLYIIFRKSNKEKFTAPGLTLTNPPSWFPQNSAKAYNINDWKSLMYLDRYPFRYNKDDYLSQDESDKMASVYKFWRN